MNFTETVEYLFSRLPMFQNIGKAAYKKDLTNTLLLLEKLGNPHKEFPWIHIAGTNGKGSTSSMISSILLESGYKVGLYTSPHLKSFTERIRVDGLEMEKEFVIDFVSRMKQHIESIEPSFFEITVAMCFDYFRYKKIDVGVIEVGLGGRLDSTNVIDPILSVITSIGYDHMDLLGDTLEKIAFEKAGIIKRDTPVVVNSHIPNGPLSVITNEAVSRSSPIVYAVDLRQSAHLSLRDFIESQSSNIHLAYEIKSKNSENKYQDYPNSKEWMLGDLLEILELKGNYQEYNLSTTLHAIRELRSMNYTISADTVIEGLKNITKNSGLRGRWERIRTSPLVICDTGHNEDGVKSNISQLLNLTPSNKLHIIWGMVKDKDRSKILQLLPKDSQYYLVKPQVIRGLEADLLSLEFQSLGFSNVNVHDDILDAYSKALSVCEPSDTIFIGGSTFTVADFLIQSEL